LQLLVLKLSNWPKTSSALVSPDPGVPVATNGELYSSARLLPVSATYKLPELSTATPLGFERLKALMPPLLAAVEKESGCPITRSAGLPLVRALMLAHPSTRLLAVSAT